MKILQYATAFFMLLFAIMSSNQMAFVGGLRGAAHSRQKRDKNSLQQEFPRGNPPAFNTNPDTSANSFAEVEISTGVGDDDYALFLYEQLNDGHLNRELFSRYLAARHVVEKDDDYVWEDAEKQT